ncbi:MAG: hypothetical protein IJ881_09795, partial [Neisseriaceae bacterium]|nr:hypothetical protein [Neisseriaceae bacterium]
DTDNRYANADASVAIGYNAHTHAANAVALGSGADATGERSISIGGAARDDDNESRHQGSRSAGQGSIAIGDQARVVATKTGGKDDSAVMERDTDANDAVAIGTQALAKSQSSIALGGGVSLTTEQSDGSNKTEYTKAGAVAGGTNVEAAIAIGGASQGTNAAQATGQYAIALGTGNAVSGSQSAAVGTGSTVTTGKTFVLGSNVSTTHDNSVFLGDSAAYVADGTSSKGVAAYEKETINGTTFQYAGGGSATVAGVVSVGNGSQTRRIQNVAPGLISADSTDAINGSQLYGVAKAATANIQFGSAGNKVDYT